MSTTGPEEEHVTALQDDEHQIDDRRGDAEESEEPELTVQAAGSRGGVGTVAHEGIDEKDAAQIPWAHLDIAGAANNAGSPHGEVAKGPTGATVRTLIALAEDFSRP